MGEMINMCKALIGYLKGKDHPEDLNVDDMIILEWTGCM
jgi:hypothetical protein